MEISHRGRIPKFRAASAAILIGATLAAGADDRVVAQSTPLRRVSAGAFALGESEISGTVTSRFGPEPGVWVIAETGDLGTRFAKIVVTDERGRYLIPDLPKARFHVWVRGYGLVDSPKIDAEPGRKLDLEAVVAPSLAAAAQYYPAIYWYALLEIPDASRFPGTGPNGNGMPESFKRQDQWLDISRPTAAAIATRSAITPRARSRPHSAISIRRATRGPAACNPARPGRP